MRQSKNFPDNFYRVTIKGVCVADEKVLLAKESSANGGQWEMLGGGLDFGETPREALEREVKEEAGLTIMDVSKEPIYVWSVKNEKKKNLSWFYSMVLVYGIKLENYDFAPSDECAEIAWFSASDLQTADLFEQSAPLRDRFDFRHFKAEL